MRELADGDLASSFTAPVKISCASCGRFLCEAYSAALVKMRCASCKASVAILIKKDQNVTASILSTAPAA